MITRLKTRVKRWLLSRWGLLNHADFGRTAFSQDGEDVLLYRMMDHNHEAGTYVDVGCNHPYKYSNTAFFYDRGWSGVAIDPNPAFAAEFESLRPRDTFINCGVSNIRSVMIYHRFEEPLLNTFDADKAKSIAGRISEKVGTESVQVRRLDDILFEVWPNGMNIRFLSIDCEGLDLAVLESHDFAAFPVDFLCVEIDNVALKKSLDERTVTLLSKQNFLPIAKLYKSMILASESAVTRWQIL